MTISVVLNGGLNYRHPKGGGSETDRGHGWRARRRTVQVFIECSHYSAS